MQHAPILHRMRRAAPLRSAPVRSEPAYDRIGRTYVRTRTTDPRVAARVHAAVGPARRVLNVGAGTGNYEPPGVVVTALEPSMTMIRHRADDAAPVVQGVAEHLPFADDSFDVTMGTLTLHHWSDLAAGLAEVRRVSRRQVFLLFDIRLTHGFWLLDYFPQVRGLASEADAPTPDDLRAHLDVRHVEAVPVPADCTDGFGAAFWNRPERYLEPDVLAGMSFTAVLDPGDLRAGVDALAADLASGRWDHRHGNLRELAELDVGYRLVVAGVTSP